MARLGGSCQHLRFITRYSNRVSHRATKATKIFMQGLNLLATYDSILTPHHSSVEKFLTRYKSLIVAMKCSVLIVLYLLLNNEYSSY
jgi:hypothetical protein